MTIRQILRSKLRKAIIAMIIGFILIIGGSVIEITLVTEKVPIMPFIGFGCIILAQLYIYFLIKCTKCSERLGVVIMYTSNIVKYSMKINYCPFCGVNFDSDFIGPA